MEQTLQHVYELDFWVQFYSLGRKYILTWKLYVVSDSTVMGEEKFFSTWEFAALKRTPLFASKEWKIPHVKT